MPMIGYDGPETLDNETFKALDSLAKFGAICLFQWGAIKSIEGWKLENGRAVPIN